MIAASRSTSPRLGSVYKRLETDNEFRARLVMKGPAERPESDTEFRSRLFRASITLPNQAYTFSGGSLDAYLRYHYKAEREHVKVAWSSYRDSELDDLAWTSHKMQRKIVEDEA